MGTPANAAPVKRIVGVLAASPDLLDAAATVLAASIGAIELASEPSPWTVSRYYATEMGDAIWRQYLAMVGVMAPEELVALKLETNRLEERWRDQRGRRVNLDPGYVNATTLVLASTKAAAHRVYLGRGIYAEATLSFANGGFQAWPYTYPDYAAPEVREFFNRVRGRYREANAAAPVGGGRDPRAR